MKMKLSGPHKAKKATKAQSSKRMGMKAGH
jgi:hypothetical protein